MPTHACQTVRTHEMQKRIGETSKCSICSGRGSSLPKNCPGQPLSEKQQQGVALGTLDYRSGRWHESANSSYAFMRLNDELHFVGTSTNRMTEIQAILDSSEYHLKNGLGCVLKKALVESADFQLD